MKQVRYAFEAIFLYLLSSFFKILSPHRASEIGGWIGRVIGPRLAASRKAKRHLEKAMPNLTQAEQHHIINGMWDNLARVIAEYPHLKEISQNHTKIEHRDEVLKTIKDNTPIVFIAAHLSNWEVNSLATLLQLEHRIDLTYREPNNPWVAKLLKKYRTLNNTLTAHPKSHESGRKILQAMRNGKSIGILIDQKYNEGLNIPFFGLDAMTNPIFVRLAQKYKVPIIPVRNQRLKGCNFKITAYPEIPTYNKDGSPRTTEEVIEDAHSLLESWIKEDPEQWIWLHKRWGKSKRA